MSRPNLIVCAALTTALVPFLVSQSSVKRPPITGVAHVALKTNDLTADAKTLRDYPAGKGVDVPATVSKGWDGNLSFQVKDPEGHRIAFVQYLTGPEGAVGIFTNQGPVGAATAGSKAEFDAVKQEYRITGGGAHFKT